MEQSDPTFSSFLELRGNFSFTGAQKSSSRRKSQEEKLRHVLPIDREHLLIHTQSSVALHYLPAHIALWTIECPSFNFAFTGQRNVLALTPENAAASLVLWDVCTGSILHRLAYRDANVLYHVSPNGLVFSPDGRFLTAGLENDDETLVAIWDSEDGRLLHCLKMSEYDDITALAFHPDGTMVAGGSFNNTKIWFWSLVDGRLLYTWEYTEDKERRDRTYDLAFHSDGTLLFAGCGASGLCVWNVAQAHEVPGPNTQLWPDWITISPDGESLAVAHFDGRASYVVRVLETNSWRMNYEFAGNRPSETFTPDGQILATIRDRSTIDLWDIRTGAFFFSYTV